MMFKSHNSQAEPLPIEHFDSRKVLHRNHKLVKYLYYFMSLEVPMNQSSFSNRWLTLFIARARFYIFMALIVKFILIHWFLGCENAQLRHYLGDWTILYPEERRPAQLKVFLVVALVHAATKRSVFFRRPFDRSLFDYLKRLPGESEDLTISETNRRVMMSKWETRRFEKSSNFDSFHTSFALPMHDDGEPTSADEMGADLDGDGWSSTLAPRSSRRRGRRFTNSFYSWEMVEGLIDLSETAAITCNRDRDHWFCVSSKMHRWFIYACCIYGALMGLPLLGATARMALLSRANECDEEPVLIRVLGSLELAYMMSETLITGIGILVVQMCVCEDIDYQVRKLRKHFNRLTYARDMNADAGNRLDYPVLADKRSDRKRTRSSHYGSDSITYGYNQPPSAGMDDSMMDNLREVQRKTVGALVCLERHRRLLTFLGNTASLWFITSLSFVPLVATVKATTRENRIALGIYYGIITASAACYFNYAILSARLNRHVTDLVRLIHQTCARFPDELTTNGWNRVINVWFCPPRCAIRVLGMLDLTYVSILESISYLLSGVTLVLNFLDN